MCCSLRVFLICDGAHLGSYLVLGILQRANDCFGCEPVASGCNAMRALEALLGLKLQGAQAG